MKLFSATPSPYARKVRIALAEKKLPFELVTEVPWNADTTTPRYNPLKKLPVLILDDGTTVYESRTASPGRMIWRCPSRQRHCAQS